MFLRSEKLSAESRPFVNGPPYFLGPCIPVPVIPITNCVYNSTKHVRRNALESIYVDSSADIGSPSTSSDSLGPERNSDATGGPSGRGPVRTRAANRSETIPCWTEAEEKLFSVVSLHCAIAHDPALAQICDYGSSRGLQTTSKNVYHTICNEVTLLPCLSNPATTARVNARIQGRREGEMLHGTTTPSTLPCPAFVVGYQRDGLELNASMLRFWSNLRLQPVGAPKTIFYYVVCPSDLASHMAFFLKEVSAHYHASHLGVHRAGGGAPQPLFLYNRYPPGGRARGQSPDGQVRGQSAMSGLRCACLSLLKAILHDHPRLRYGAAHLEGSPHASLMVYVVPPRGDPQSVMVALREASRVLTPHSSSEGAASAPSPPDYEASPAPAFQGDPDRTERYRHASQRTYKRHRGSSWRSSGPRFSPGLPLGPSWPFHIQMVTEQMVGDPSASAPQGVAFSAYLKARGGQAETLDSAQLRPLVVLPHMRPPLSQDALLLGQGREAAPGGHQAMEAESPEPKAQAVGSSSNILEARGGKAESEQAPLASTLHCCYSYQELASRGAGAQERGPSTVGRAVLFVAWTDSQGELLTWRCLPVLPRKADRQKNLEETGPGPPGDRDTHVGLEGGLPPLPDRDLVASICSTVLAETARVANSFQSRGASGVSFPRLLICRLGKPTIAEGEAWRNLLTGPCVPPASSTSQAETPFLEPLRSMAITVLSLECPSPSRLAGCQDRGSGAFLEVLQHPREAGHGGDPWGRGGRARITWLPAFGPPQAPLFPSEIDCVRQLYLDGLLHRSPSQPKWPVLAGQGAPVEGTAPLSDQDIGFERAHLAALHEAGEEVHRLGVLSGVLQGLTTNRQGGLGPWGWASPTSHLPLHCHTVQSMECCWICLFSP
eukprot:jgi/Botrbrau1/9912/Bobra.0012s0013.1